MLAPSWPAARQFGPRAIVTLDWGGVANSLIVLAAVDCDSFSVLCLVTHTVPGHIPTGHLWHNAGCQAGWQGVAPLAICIAGCPAKMELNELLRHCGDGEGHRFEVDLLINLYEDSRNCIGYA